MPLRETFDSDAERYDRIRPRYPEALWDELESVGGLGPGSRVLEIGIGTGQATEQLAERGYRVLGIELGPRLATLAVGRLARFGPQVKIVVDSFDTWRSVGVRFDAVVAATSFHWLDPATRVQRAAACLRRDGVLATIATHHVAGGDDATFELIQQCYRRWDPDVSTDVRLPRASEIPSEDAEIVGSGLFDAPVFRRYEWEQSYTTLEYLDLLRTYSGHIALGGEALEGLLGCIGEVIDRHGGRIRKGYLNELRVARRRWRADPPGARPDGRTCCR